MNKIKTIYLISHVHTDIGYTDHQTILFRQHNQFIDRAIELCEQTADYPPEARYHWTCEVASSVERFMQSRSASQIDRFLKLNAEGRIAVSAMAYHWTPMLSPAAMLRSLGPAMRLRRDYGVRIDSAMQCDVDGVSWLWADILPAIGVKGLTMSINAYRGDRPKPDLTAFWWQGPGGNRLLTFNGPHYDYGISFYGMGEIDWAETLLPPALARLEADDAYPYDFLYAQATHPALSDNGPPYEALSDFVRDWNAQGRTPRIIFTTVDGFLTMLHERYGAMAPTWRGDWADWWADGVATSAYETAISRTTEALLPGLDMLAAQVDGLDFDLIEQAYHDVSLYDEHTWGAFNSVTQPHSPFAKAQWNRKAGFAYEGYALTHALLAQTGRQMARDITGKSPEGDIWRKWKQGAQRAAVADEASQRFLLVNTLSWSRTCTCPLPFDSGGGAPYNFLEAAFSNYRDSYPQSVTEGLSDSKNSAKHLSATLPAFAYELVAPTPATPPADSRLGMGWIENQWYRIEVDPQTGALERWLDKDQSRELVERRANWHLGHYLYERTDDPTEREALFIIDFSREGYGVQQTDTAFRRESATRVEIGPALVDELGAHIEVELQAPGARTVRVRYSLPHHEKALHIDMIVDKKHITAPEAIYILFPFALSDPSFHLDLNGVPLSPEAEQLPGTCRDWYGIQRWAEVGDERTSIVMTPLDAPLIQVGGIQTGRWAKQLQANDAMLVSWPVNNYWTTNFRAGQSGELLFRYRLTSMPAYDPAAASRFAAEQLIPPLIVRVPDAALPASGSFLAIEPEGLADVQIKRADDGRGLILHAFNFTDEPQTIACKFSTLELAAAWQCSPIEEDGAAIDITDNAILLPTPPRSLTSARVLFA